MHTILMATPRVKYVSHHDQNSRHGAAWLLRAPLLSLRVVYSPEDTSGLIIKRLFAVAFVCLPFLPPFPFFLDSGETHIFTVPKTLPYDSLIRTVYLSPNNETVREEEFSSFQRFMGSPATAPILSVSDRPSSLCFPTMGFGVQLL